MIGIIGAMTVEIEGLVAAMENKRKKTVGGMVFYRGILHGKDVVIVKCGVGKVNAAMCAQAMILKYKPELIINAGVAAGLLPGMEPLDVAVAESVLQHDFDTSPLGGVKGRVEGLPDINILCSSVASRTLFEASKKLGYKTFYGNIATGDQFIDREKTAAGIRDGFNAIAAEMEGGSIGQVCFLNKTPFAALRVLSDTGSSDAPFDFERFCQSAAERSYGVVREFLGNRE